MEVVTVTAARYDTLVNAIHHQQYEGWVVTGVMIHEDGLFKRKMMRFEDT